MSPLPVASTSRGMVSASRQASTLTSNSASSVLSSQAHKLPYRGRLTESPETRRYPIEKSAKFESYKTLFTESELLLFLRVDSLSVKELSNLRADIKAMVAKQQQAHQDAQVDLTLTSLRANLVPPVLSSLPHLPSSLISQHTKGPLAVVSARSLHPPTLAQFLKIYNKHARELNKPKEEASVKGPGGKKMAPQPRDRLVLRSGVAEQSRELDPAGVQQLSTLPDLKGVQAQLVGVIDATGLQLARVLSQAGGSQLAQTLEGFKVGMEKEQEGSQEA